MGMDAVAVVKVDLGTVKRELRPAPGKEPVKAGCERLRGAHGMPVLVRGVGDATLVYTGARLSGAEPDELGLVVRHVLGGLLDAHEDDRGILVFPDVVEPKGQSYAELVEEIGEAGEWVPVVDAGYVPERMREAQAGSFEAALGDVMSMLGPQMMEMQRALLGGNVDPEAMRAAVDQVQEAIGGEGGESLMEAVGRMMGGMDMAALQAQAVKLLEDNPELAASLAERFGSAIVEDDETIVDEEDDEEDEGDEDDDAEGEDAKG